MVPGLNTLIAISLICWSIWGIFDKKALEAAKHLDVLIFQHIIYVFEIPVCFLILYLKCGGLFEVAPEAWLWTFFGSLVSSLAMLFYLIAMSRAQASYVLGITASYPLVVQVLAFFFLNEPIVQTRLLGSILVGGGVAAIGGSSDPHEIDVSDNRGKHQFILLSLCVLATLFWGITGMLDKKALLVEDPFKVYYARCVWDALLLVFMLIAARLLKHKPAWNARRAWKYSIYSSVSVSLGTVCYMFAMTMATASYVIVITGCYPLFMYLFAMLFLKEKLDKLRVLGVLLVVLGGLMVQTTQSL